MDKQLKPVSTSKATNDNNPYSNHNPTQPPNIYYYLPLSMHSLYTPTIQITSIYSSYSNPKQTNYHHSPPYIPNPN